MGRITILLLALWAAGSQAQQPGDQGADVQAPDAQEPAAATGDGATDEQQQPAGDPFDYESSEQISEDLSVSFPVDI